MTKNPQLLKLNFKVSLGVIPPAKDLIKTQFGFPVNNEILLITINNTDLTSCHIDSEFLFVEYAKQLCQYLPKYNKSYVSYRFGLLEC